MYVLGEGRAGRGGEELPPPQPSSSPSPPTAVIVTFTVTVMLMAGVIVAVVTVVVMGVVVRSACYRIVMKIVSATQTPSKGLRDPRDTGSKPHSTF